MDSRSGEEFEFQILADDEQNLLGVLEKRGTGWFWQREILDWILENEQTIILKGRQLGVTWIACGLALWYLLYKPGSDVLVYSITEDDAKEVIGRIWDMLTSLPVHLRNGARTIRPSRAGVRPSEAIEVEHIIDGRPVVSSINAMSSSSHAGHGRSAALVIFDEASRQEHASTSWKAVVPATADAGGKIAVISTANGMSDERSGTGNFFHHLWANAGKIDYPKLKKRFLGWWLHPERDEEWYENVGLKADDRAEQYPNDPDEAFLMSGRPFFDAESMKWYGKHGLAELLYRCEFVPDEIRPRFARRQKGDGLPIEVFVEPQKDRKYAIGADVASGDGLDYSVAAVIDLHTGEPCAELRMRAGYDDFAEQLHFLGLWYNVARLAVENQGGYGAAVIAYLRESIKGRKPYPKLYKHRKFDRPDHAESATFGIPMDSKTRPKVVNELKSWVDDKLFPYVTEGFLSEAKTFVRRDKKPTPAAADGTNDDVVMAWGIVLELYSQFGEHEHDRRKVTKKKNAAAKPKPSFPW